MVARINLDSPRGREALRAGIQDALKAYDVGELIAIVIAVAKGAEDTQSRAQAWVATYVSKREAS